MSRSLITLSILGLIILALVVALSFLLGSRPAGMVLAPEPPAPAPSQMTTDELSETIAEAVIRSNVRLEVPAGGLLHLRP